MRTLLVFACLAACGAPPAPDATPPAAPGEAPAGARTDTDVAGLKAALEGGAVLIDVRTPQEFAAGHVPGAVNVPLGFDPASDPAVQGLDKGAPVYVICQSGRRSSTASDQLAGAGFRAVNVQGGTAGWIAAGNPVE